MIVSVPLDPADFQALSGVAARQGRTIVDVTGDVIHKHAMEFSRAAAG